MRTINVLEKTCTFWSQTADSSNKKHLEVHLSSPTLQWGLRMLFKKWLETSGLTETLQSNKSPTSNSSIKVSPKTFKVIHSFSKKRHWKGFATLQSCWNYIICHDIIPSFPHPSFSHCTLICENVLRTRFCVCVHVNNNWCKKYPVRDGVLLKYKSTYCYFI